MGTPLRIALLKSSVQVKGGLEKYCQRITDALTQRGHRVTILSTTAAQDPLTIKVSRKVPCTPLQLLWFDYHCRQWLANNPQDVVFGFDRHFLSLTHYRAGNGCHAAFLSRRMVEASFFKKWCLLLNPLHLLLRFSEHLTFERRPNPVLICNSNLVKEEILHHYPKTNPKSLFVVHNGVEWFEFEKPFAERSPPSVPALLFIGHEWDRKGLDRLLYALALIKEHPFHLTAIGRERNPGRFYALVHTLGLSEKVSLIPRAQPSLPFYQSCHIAIIPSRYDPFANTTVEAMAMGLFVITTKANGGSEVISPGLSGTVLEENPSPQALAGAIADAFPRIQNPNLPFLIRSSAKQFDFSKKLSKIVSLIEA